MNLARHLAGPCLALLLGPVCLAQEPVEAGPGAQETPQQEKPQKPQRPPIYDESADARGQIAEALAAAKRENRRVLIQWGANWCGWCHLLHDLFEKNAQVKRTLLYEYDLVLIDIGRWDKNLDLAATYGADFKRAGVPYLTVLDADGNVLANQETGALEAKIDGKPGHDPEKVLAFLKEHQAPYLSAESILSDGLKRAREEGKIVFLHFGAPWCGWCHRLEDWMARKDVHDVLDRSFVNVKIDIDRTIGGKDLMAVYTEGKRTGIPFFVFLAADRKVIAASWGPDGENLGCPWTTEEVKAFKGLLRTVAPAMSLEDIDAITATLGEKKKQEPAGAAGG